MANPITLIHDLADLSRSGFKAEDIREIMASEKKEVERPAETAQKDETQPDQEKTEEEKPTPEAQPDYKMMYDELKAKQDKLEKDLADAQKFNTSKTVTAENKKSTADQINEMYQNLLS